MQEQGQQGQKRRFISNVDGRTDGRTDRRTDGRLINDLYLSTSELGIHNCIYTFEFVSLACMYHIQALDTFVSKRTNVPSEHCTLLIMTSRYDHLAPIIIPYEDTDTSTVGHHFLYKVAHFKVP